MRADRRGRGLNLGDLMILVAATGVGIWLVPGSVWEALDHLENFGRKDQFYHLFAFTTALVVAWTWGWLAIRLRPPRPGFRRLMHQPGMVAALSATAGSAIEFGSTLLSRGQGRGWVEWHRLAMIDLVVLPEYLMMAVVGAWLTLALGGRWRPEAGPIDRIGRALGLGWVGLWSVERAVSLLS